MKNIHSYVMKRVKEMPKSMDRSVAFRIAWKDAKRLNRYEQKGGKF